MRLLLAICCALLLPACAMTQSTFAPQSYHTLDKDIADLRSKFGIATSIDQYYDGTAETEAGRNEFIAKRLALYDLEYLRFVQTLRLGRAEMATVFDHGLLGLGLATTLAAGAHTKTVLGAVTTAVIGSRASFEKNFYADQTTLALISQMNAERKVALLPILQGITKPIGEYPMSQALLDLSAYQAAGTMDAALIGVQKGAVAKEATASAAIAQYRTHAYQPDDSTARIWKWLYPGFVSFDANGDALDANGTIVPINSANYQSLRAEIAKLGLDGIALPAFQGHKALASSRAQAIIDLSIP